uniref:Uncharacterized protein n=1 Tax=Bracon brevicornis TaxID=1563983 RepID=A0A6V7L5E6_9HYME
MFGERIRPAVTCFVADSFIGKLEAKSSLCSHILSGSSFNILRMIVAVLMLHPSYTHKSLCRANHPGLIPPAAIQQAPIAGVAEAVIFDGPQAVPPLLENQLYFNPPIAEEVQAMPIVMTLVRQYAAIVGEEQAMPIGEPAAVAPPPANEPEVILPDVIQPAQVVREVQGMPIAEPLVGQEAPIADGEQAMPIGKPAAVAPPPANEPEVILPVVIQPTQVVREVQGMPITKPLVGQQAPIAAVAPPPPNEPEVILPDVIQPAQVAREVEGMPIVEPLAGQQAPIAAEPAVHPPVVVQPANALIMAARKRILAVQQVQIARMAHLRPIHDRTKFLHIVHQSSCRRSILAIWSFITMYGMSKAARRCVSASLHMPQATQLFPSGSLSGWRSPLHFV